MHGSHCGDLVEKTATALNEDAVMLMLLAVQRNNVKLSVTFVWKRVHCLATFEVENVIHECLFAFPYIWVWKEIFDDEEFLEFRFIDKSEDLFKKSESDRESLLKPITKHIISLYTIQNLIVNKSSHLHLLLAVTLILKHATFLQISVSPKSALTKAEQHYQKANLDVIIQQHLTACASEQSIEQFVGFIMSTDIVSSQSSALTAA